MIYTDTIILGVEIGKWTIELQYYYDSIKFGNVSKIKKRSRIFFDILFLIHSYVLLSVDIRLNPEDKLKLVLFCFSIRLQYLCRKISI